MAKKNEIQIVITAVDKASKVLDKTGLSLGGLAKVGGIAASAVAGIAAGMGVAAFKLAKDAAPIEGIKKSFEGLANSMPGGAKKILAAMEDSSYGMIKQSDLMKSFNTASQLVSKDFAQQLPDAMRYLGKVSAATGTDMNYMMDSLVKGVGRLSPMILDNLGIQVSLEEATANAAATFGVEASALDKTQIQAGMMNVVMEKLKLNTADMPEVAGTAAQAFATLQAKFADFKEYIGLKLLPVFQTVATELVKIWDKPETKVAIDKLITWLEGVVGDENSGLVGIVTYLAAGNIEGAIALAFGEDSVQPIMDFSANVGNVITFLGKLDTALATNAREVDKYGRIIDEETGEITVFWQRFDEVVLKWPAMMEGLKDDMEGNVLLIGLIIAYIPKYFADMVNDVNLEMLRLKISVYNVLVDIANEINAVLGTEIKVPPIDISGAVASGISSGQANARVNEAENKYTANKVQNWYDNLPPVVPTSHSSRPPNIHVSSGRASGGSVSGGLSYLVGERGMEVFTPRTSGNITPNHQLGGQSLSLTININSAVNLADRSYAERELMPYIEAGVRQLMARGA